MTPQIAICLQTCDRRTYTARTLDTFGIQNQGRGRWMLLHGDDASKEEGICELAQSHGFETVVRHETRRGARATRDALFQAAANAGADWILLLENDWEWVRPFPWTPFEWLIAERPDVYSLRLYGAYKGHNLQAKCATHHLGHAARPTVAWWHPPTAPDALEIAKVHWGAPPAITRTKELLQIAGWVRGSRDPGDAAENRVSGKIDQYIARVPDNIVYHIGERPTIRTRRTFAPPLPRAAQHRAALVKPPLYTPQWQQTRNWTLEHSTRCLLTLLASFRHPPTGLLDVGCGTGHLVKLAQRRGIASVGVDLSVPADSADPSVRHADLCQPLDLQQTYPVVTCWEVAEHLPPEAADTLCDSLVKHVAENGLLFFTAATPGQSGQGHVNCQPHSFWREKLEARGLRYEPKRTALLATQWKAVAPRTPWYGKNLQVFRRPLAVSTITVTDQPNPIAPQIVSPDLPRLAITMRTADRSPNPNYLGGTVKRLLAQGLPDGALQLCVTDPDATWLDQELGANRERVTLHVPETRRTPNENGLAQIRSLDADAYDWVLLLEDDLVFCADFVDSVRRWIVDHAKASRHFYRLFAFRVTPPHGKQPGAYDVSMDRCAGSQAVLLRMADAQDFLAWADANLESWGGFRGNAKIAFDKLLASWLHARYGKEPGVLSSPMFVKHIGKVSSLHPKTATMDAQFAGTGWSYTGTPKKAEKAEKVDRPRVTVPKLWPGETFVCIGGGTVTQEEVDSIRGRARVVAVNDAYKLAPWADALYAADQSWWKAHQGVPDFAGLKYAIEQQMKGGDFPSDVTVLRNTGKSGLEREPSGLRTGDNSGFQAINLAVHLGARRIVLLGYDVGRLQNGRAHWFGNHPSPLGHTSQEMFVQWRALFATLVQPLDDLGIAVLNASRHTALECFPKVQLETALSAVAA